MSVWAKDKNWLSLYRKEQTKQHVLSIQNKDMQIKTFLSLFKLKSRHIESIEGNNLHN